jgi:hypothetical protein
LHRALLPAEKLKTMTKTIGTNPEYRDPAQAESRRKDIPMIITSESER